MICSRCGSVPMADARVVSVSSILVDLTVDVPRLPDRGGDVLATATRLLVGGGFNLAAAVARQGATCVYAGPHGTGPYGDLVRGALAAEGIVAGGVPRTEGDTGFCVNLVEPDAERTFVTVTGVETSILREELDALGVGGADLVSVSGYDLAYPQSGPVLARWVHELAGRALVAFDPGPLVGEIPAELLDPVVEAAFLVSMNQREARLVAGAPELSGAALLAALRSALAVDAETVVIVREGAEGCIACGGELGAAPLAFRSPAVEAVDTTGAGDTHTGVLLAELALGHGLRRAIERATLAAGISVTRVGSATAPTREEVDAAASTHP